MSLRETDIVTVVPCGSAWHVERGGKVLKSCWSLRGARHWQRYYEALGAAEAQREQGGWQDKLRLQNPLLT